MAIFDFPTSPTTGQVYTANGKSWRFDGTSWKAFNTLGISGGGTGKTNIEAGDAFLSSNSAGTALTYRKFIAGSNMSIAISASDVTFTSTGTGGAGTTAQNINLVQSSIDSNFYIPFTSSTSGSGVALSAGLGLSFNPSSNTLITARYQGTWAGSTITTLYGGTGLTSPNDGDLLAAIGNSWYGLAKGNTGQVLTVSASSPYLTWQNVASGTAASSIDVAADNLSDASRYLTFVNSNGGSGLYVSTDSTLVYNPSLDTLYVSALAVTSSGFASTGSLVGNALQVTSSIGSSTMYARRIVGVGLTTFMGDGAGNVRAELYDGLTDTGFRLYSGGKNLPIAQISLDSAGGGIIGLKFNAKTTGSLQDAINAVSIGAPSADTGAQLALRASDGVSANRIRMLVIGGAGSSMINEIAFGPDTTSNPFSGTGMSVILRGPNATGTDVASGDMIIQSGRATGTGSQGNITFRVAIPGVTGSTLNTINNVGRFNFVQNSTSTSTGTFTIVGGIGITGNAFIGGTVTAPSFFGNLIAAGATADNFYGNLTGFASTTRNVNVVLANNPDQIFSVVITPSNATSSGAALSIDSEITYNPSTNLLSVGSLAANGVTVGSAQGTINTSTGNLILNSASGTVQISGNLVVNGNTTSIGSTISTLLDPIFVLGAGNGGTNPTFDDNKDRGIEFRYFSGVAKTGFFGFDDSTGYFTFIPDGINTDEVFSGVAGTIQANLVGTASTSLYANQSGFASTAGNANTSGLATTAQTLNLVLNNSATGNHPLTFTPSISTASGAAQSINNTLNFVPSTNILNVSGLAVTSSTATGSTLTGALIVTGGAAVGQSLSVGSRINLFNGEKYASFIYSGGGPSTVYTLPVTAPSTGNSVLQSNSTGTMSWVPMTSIGFTVDTGAQYQIGYYPQTGVAITGSGSGLTWNNGLLSIGQTNLNTSALVISTDAGYASVATTGGIVLKPLQIATDPFDSYLPAPIEFRNSYWDYDNLVALSDKYSITFNEPYFSTLQFTYRNALTGRQSTPLIINASSDQFLQNVRTSNGYLQAYTSSDSGNVSYKEDVPGLELTQSATTSLTGGTNFFPSPYIEFTAHKSDGIYGDKKVKGYIKVQPFGTSYNDSAFIFGLWDEGDYFGTPAKAATATTAFMVYTSGLVRAPVFISSSGTTTGTLVVSGGVGISENVNIGGTASIRSGSELRIYRSANDKYSGFKYTGSVDSMYTLPELPASNNLVLSTTTGGVLSWVAAPAAASATTAQNVNIENGANNSSHPLIFTLNKSSSGSALSANGTLVYNPGTDILTTSGLSVTSGLGISAPLGPNSLTVNGGIGASALFVTEKVGIGLSTLSASRIEMYNASSDYGLKFYEASKGQARFTLSRNAFGSNIPGLLFKNDSAANDNTGAVGIGMPNASGLYQLVFYASDGFQRNRERLNILAASGTSYLNTIIFGADTSSIATTSTVRGVDASGTDIQAGDLIIQSGRSTGTGLPGQIKFKISNSTSSSSTLNTLYDVVNINSIQNASSTLTGSLRVSGGVGITGNALIGGTVGITNNSVSTSTTSGALVVTGGVGIAGSLYVGGVGASISGINILNGVINTGVWAGTAITTAYGGHGAIPIVTKGDVLVGSGNTWYNFPIGSNDFVLTADNTTQFGVKWAAVTATNAALATTAQNINVTSSGSVNTQFYIPFTRVISGSGVALSSDLGISYNPSTLTMSVSGLAVTSSTNSSSTTTGALTVAGGLGLAGNAFIGGTITAPSFIGNVSASGITANNFYGNLTGTATTANNVSVQNSSGTNSSHLITFVPSQNASGAALSSDITFTFNPNTEILSVSGILVTAGLAQTSPAGPNTLNVNGGIGASSLFAANSVGVGLSTLGVSRVELYRNSSTGDVGLRHITNSLGPTVPRFFLSADGMNANIPGLGFVNGNNAWATHGAGLGLPTSTATNQLTVWISNGTAQVQRMNWYGSSTRLNINEMSLGSDVSATATTSLVRGVNASGTDIAAGDFVLQAGRATGTGAQGSIVFRIATQNTSGSALNTLIDVAKLNLGQGSTSISNGTFIVYGGVGITGNAFIGGTVTAPSFAGNLTALGITSPNIYGNLIGTATTAQNVSVQNSGQINASHLITFVPSQSASGVAISSDQTFTYNPSTEILSVSGLAVTASTATGSTLTGALIVTGGAAVGQSLSVGSRINFFNGESYSAFAYTGGGPSTVYYLPRTAPTGVGNSFLVSNSLGVMSWVPQPSGGSGSPGGLNTQIQFNDSASFGGDAEFTFNKLTNQVSIASSSRNTYYFEREPVLTLYNGDAAATAGTRWSPALQFRSESVFDNIAVDTYFHTFKVASDGKAGSDVGKSSLRFRYAQYVTAVGEYQEPANSSYKDIILLNNAFGLGIAGTAATNVNYFRTSNTQSSDKSYVLPTGYPSVSGYVLSSDTSGNMSWISGGGSGGTAASVEVKTVDATSTYYITGVTANPSVGVGLSASNNLTLDVGQSELVVGYNIHGSVTENVVSPASQSGSIYAEGGVAIAGNSFIGGTVTITDITNSISAHSGSLVAKGGVGVAGTINIGGNAIIRGGNELRLFDTTNTGYFGFDYAGTTTKTYILPNVSDTADGYLYLKGSASSSNQLQWLGGVGTVISKSVTIFVPSAGDEVTLFETFEPITVVGITGVNRGTGVGLTWTLNYNIDRSSLVGTTINVGTAGTFHQPGLGATTTGIRYPIQNASIGNTNYVWLRILQVGGTIPEFNLTLHYRKT